MDVVEELHAFKNLSEELHHVKDDEDVAVRNEGSTRNISPIRSLEPDVAYTYYAFTNKPILVMLGFSLRSLRRSAAQDSDLRTRQEINDSAAKAQRYRNWATSFALASPHLPPLITGKKRALTT